MGRMGAILAAAAVLGTAIGIARADQFFSVTATNTAGTTTLTVGGRNIIDLTNHLINQEDQFVALASQGFNAKLTYGGVPNAVVITENPQQTQATVKFNTTGFSKTFTGSNSSDLQTQIQDFIKQDGLNQYAQFLISMNRLSLVASIDGNPLASTALIGDEAFNRFGLEPTLTEPVNDAHRTAPMPLDVVGGTSRAAGLNGNFGGVSFGGNIRFTDSVALDLITEVDYRSVSGSNIGTAAEIVGLPVTLLRRHADEDGLAWQLTPWGFGGISASYDLAEGAILIGGGGTSSLSYRWEDFTFTLADQIDYIGNEGVTVANYSFDVPVDQWLLKNGVQVLYQPNGGPLILDAGGAYSNFLHHGAVPNYWTPTAGAAFKLGRLTLIRAGFVGDFARHFTECGGEVSLELRW